MGLHFKCATPPSVVSRLRQACIEQKQWQKCDRAAAFLETQLGLQQQKSAKPTRAALISRERSSLIVRPLKRLVCIVAACALTAARAVWRAALYP